MPDLLTRLQEALSGRFRVERIVGRGGMATVFLAEDLNQARRVAIKVLDPEVAAAIGPERFLREIEIAAQLTHPHILPLHESGAADGLLFYVMPYVEGESLRDLLDREKQLSLEDALRITKEVADALEEAHRGGVIHRDIKPENILLEGGHALVADFGVARAVAAAGTKALTTTGVTLGTPAYMSPEQAAGSRDLDGRSDLYSLGCVLYEMLAGQPPFTGSTVESVVYQHLSAPPPGIRHQRPTVSVTVERAILRALAKNPADRFRDMSVFGKALRVEDRESVGPTTRLVRLGRRRAFAILAITAALAALAAGGLSIWKRQGALVGSHRIRTIAVLPLANLSGDPHEDYFADGITEEIITNLAKVGALRVISHTSAARYKDTRLPLRQIGRELGADGLIEGSVLRVGDRVRVSTHLIQCREDRQVWAESYDRDLSNVLALQFDLARAIARAVQATLTPKEQADLSRAALVDPMAHEDYLRGLYHWNRRTASDLGLALGYFRRATEKDSTYALAWVGISDTYGLLPSYDSVDRDEVMPKAQAAAMKALALDSTLAAAYASLGNVEKSWTLDWTKAEAYYRKAITLNPGYATAHHWYAVLLVWRGQVRDGLAEIERAHDLDPLSPVIQLTLARICYLTRDYPRAAREYEQTLELDPGRTSAWRGLSGVLFQQGRYAEASRAWERGIALLPDSLGLVPSRAVAQTASTYLARRLDTTVQLARHRLASPAELAAVYADLGEKDAAFEFLRRARPDELVLGDLRYLPDYDNLRSDSRYRIVEARLAARPAGPQERRSGHER